MRESRDDQEQSEELKILRRERGGLTTSVLVDFGGVDERHGAEVRSELTEDKYTNESARM